MSCSDVATGVFRGGCSDSRVAESEESSLFDGDLICRAASPYPIESAFVKAGYGPVLGELTAGVCLLDVLETRLGLLEDVVLDRVGTEYWETLPCERLKFFLPAEASRNAS